MRYLYKIIKQYSKDFLFRFASVAVSSIASKVVALPVLALLLDDNEYGLMLTVIGIESIISMTFGNSLNTVRLIVNNRYSNCGIIGDFNIINLCTSVCAALIMVPVCFYFDNLLLIDKVMLIPYVLIITANSYFNVYYPITLKFKDGLIQAVIGAVGLCFGLIFTYLMHSWVIAYLISSVFVLIWFVLKTDIIRESYSITELFPMTIKKYCAIMVATMFANVLVYLDRLLLFPVIGAYAVAMFVTASYFGKAMSVVIQPISIIMLGYFAQDDFSMTMKKFTIINIMSMSILAFSLILIVVLGEPITGLLFPKLIENSAPYIIVANFSASVAALTQIIQPVALRYAKTYWQTIIQFFYSVLYVTLGLTSLKSYGLFGFCYATLFCNFARYIFIFLIAYLAIRKGENNS